MERRDASCRCGSLLGMKIKHQPYAWIGDLGVRSQREKKGGEDFFLPHKEALQGDVAPALTAFLPFVFSLPHGYFQLVRLQNMVNQLAVMTASQLLFCDFAFYSV